MRPTYATKRFKSAQKNPAASGTENDTHKRDLYMHKRDLHIHKRDTNMHKIDVYIKDTCF